MTTRKHDRYKTLIEEYKKKKHHFQEKFLSWKEKGKDDLSNQGLKMLQKADEISEELNQYLVSDQMVELRRSERQLKKMIKNLREMTKPSWRQWLDALLVAAFFAFVLRTYGFGLYHVPTGSAEPTLLVGDRIWGNKWPYFFSEIKHGDQVIFSKPDFKYDRSNPFRYFWQKYIGLPIPLFGLDDVPENWVKRVIAIPGDIIEGRVENGRTVIYRNHEKLEEPYVNPYPLIRLKRTVGFFNIDSFGPFGVPGFLRTQARMRNYTYDPAQPLWNQPFYTMDEKSVVHDLYTGDYLLLHPYTPTYSFSGTVIDSFGPFEVPEGKYWVMGDSRKNSEDSRYWGFLDRNLVHGRAGFIIFSLDSEESLWLFELIKHPIDFWRKSVRWDRFGKNIV